MHHLASLWSKLLFLKCVCKLKSIYGILRFLKILRLVQMFNDTKIRARLSLKSKIDLYTYPRDRIETIFHDPFGKSMRYY